VVAALERRRVPRGTGPARNKTVRRRRVERILVLALFVVAMIAGVGGIRELASGWGSAPPASEVVPAAVETRRAAAVFGLKNLSGNPQSAWLSTALAEMLRTEMAAGEVIRLVSGEDIARAKVELGLGDVDSFSLSTLEKLRGNLGASLVMVGSYVVVPRDEEGELRVDIALQDTTTGETVLSLGQSGKESDLLSIVAVLGTALRDRLGAESLTPNQSRALIAAQPSNREALRLYALGLEALRSYDALAAKELLDQSIEIEPGFPLAHVALADAWQTLGYDGKAAEAAKTAYELSGELERETKLLIEGRLHESSRDWQKAIAAYDTLFQFYPDSLEHGLKLAAAETNAGNGVAAARTITRLRALPSPMSEDPRIDLAEGAAAEFKGDFRLELQAADRAIARARESGARLLAAAGLVRRALALRELSELDKASVSAEEAILQYREVGDLGSAARATYVLATIRDTEGRFGEAETLYRESVEVARQIGWKSLETLALSSLTSTLYPQGRYDEAVLYLREALSLAEEIGNKRHIAARHINLGNIAFLRGEIDEAERELVLANEIVDEIGDEYARQATRLVGIFVDFYRGRLTEAGAEARKLRDFFEREENPRLEAYAAEMLSRVEYYGGDPSQARTYAEEASRLRGSAKESFTKGRSDLVLAMYDLEDSKWDAAVTRATQLSATFRAQGARDYLMLSQLVLARAEQERGNREKAMRALDEADALARKTESAAMRLTWVGRSAEVRHRLGMPVDTTALDEAISEGQKRGMKLLELDLRALRARVLGTPLRDFGQEALGIKRLPLIP
jgi:tetratricopeptide (TPR) repeat protein